MNQPKDIPICECAGYRPNAQDSCHKETNPTPPGCSLLIGDCVAGMAAMPAGSVDCVVADPPYGYLRGCAADIPYDSEGFLREADRVLRPGGFFVLFGRGTPFYRMNCRLAGMGYAFKEEVVWDKMRTTSPFLPLKRVHETCTLHAKGAGAVRKVRVPYAKVRRYEPERVQGDLRRLLSCLGESRELEILRNFIRTGDPGEYRPVKTTYGVTGRGTKTSPVVGIWAGIGQGLSERDIIRTCESRARLVHPTQKPVALVERLLALTTDPGMLVLDPFSGSGTTAVACLRTGRRFVGFELDPGFHAAATARIEAVRPEMRRGRPAGNLQ